MRRSAAPSFQGSPTVKKPRTDAPAGLPPSTLSSPILAGAALAKHAQTVALPEQPPASTAPAAESEPPAALAPAQPPTPNPPAAARAPLAVARFRSPLLAKPAVAVGGAQKNAAGPTSTPAAGDAASGSDGQEAPARYYSAMWCKLSNKKHKSWESDAVLVVKGRKLTLKDSEGKDLGTTTSYGIKELLSLKSGESLIIGSKEIEINAPIAPSDYLTGKCFTASGILAASSSSLPKASAGGKKAPAVTAAASIVANGLALAAQLSDSSSKLPQFRKLVVPQGGDASSAAPIAPSPRHDPKAENALVLPRPSREHHRQFGKDAPFVVDVVVDPFLAQHLRPHQRDGVAFMYECVMGMRPYAGCGAILADEMGLGKTLQCITLLWTLYKQGPYMGRPVVKRAIVVCPSSLVKNWQKEFKKWLGDERIKTYAVTAQQRSEDFQISTVYPVMIVSYEMLRKEIDVISQISFDIVFCDEGHRLKNEYAKISQALMSLSTRRRIILTGTPIQNDLQEFYSLLEFCNPGIVGTNLTFKRIYETPIVASRQPDCSAEDKLLGQQRAQELQRLTSLFCLRRTAEVNKQYLPPKVEYVVFCAPAPLQLQIYAKVLKSTILRSCLSSSKSSQHLVCITSLKKVCNSPSLVFELARNAETSGLFSETLALFPEEAGSDTFEATWSGKLLALVSLLHDVRQTTSDRVVIVSNYTQTLDLLEKMCAMHAFPFVRLDGSTSAVKRQPIVDRFNSKSSTDFVFLLSSKAGGVGLNLVGACRLILFDTDWNPANDAQAMARVWRDGQQKTVHLYRFLLTGTIDEKIYQRQLSKQGLSVAMAGEDTDAKISFSLDELRDLFTLREDTDCDTHDLLGCVCPAGSRDPSILAAADEEDEENSGGNTSAARKKKSPKGGLERLVTTGKQKLKAKMNSELSLWTHYHRHHMDEIPEDSCLSSAVSEGFLTFVFRKLSTFAGQETAALEDVSSGAVDEDEDADADTDTDAKEDNEAGESDESSVSERVSSPEQSAAEPGEEIDALEVDEMAV